MGQFDTDGDVDKTVGVPESKLVFIHYAGERVLHMYSKPACIITA